MSEQAKLRLRSVRLDDALWERVTLAAADVGVSASAFVAGVLERSLSGAERLEESPEAPAPSPDPRPARSVAMQPAPLASVPVASVRSRRGPPGDEPRALEQPWECPHPLRARRGGVGVVRHCADCGQPFGLTGIAG